MSCKFKNVGTGRESCSHRKLAFLKVTVAICTLSIAGAHRTPALRHCRARPPLLFPHCCRDRMNHIGRGKILALCGKREGNKHFPMLIILIQKKAGYWESLAHPSQATRLLLVASVYLAHNPRFEFLPVLYWTTITFLRVFGGGGVGRAGGARFMGFLANFWCTFLKLQLQERSFKGEQKWGKATLTLA